MQRFFKFRLTRQNILIAVIVVLIIYVAVATLNVIARNYQLQQQVDQLEQENEIIALENQQLEYQIMYYQTEAFVEKEARAKLNLQEPGERVIVFPDLVPERQRPPEPEPEPEFAEEAANNFSEWAYFLFRVEI